MEFSFKKKYGQNFLIDKNIANKIVSLGENKDSLIIEIGCGDGRLTEKLCSSFKYVLGYEIDKELIPLLIENLGNYHNCNLIFDDFLNRDIKRDIKDLNKNFNNIYIFGNLPYYITTPIIEHIIKSDLNISKMVFMVQKEVGDRFCASVGNKEYNSLTVYLNYYFKIKKEFVVTKNNFIPKPNVDSVVITFTKKEILPNLKNKEIFFKLVRDSFKFKRKTLKNNLEEYDLNKVLEILKKYNYDLTVRAEQLSLEIFVEIANNL